MNAADVIDAQTDLLYRLTTHDAHGHRAAHDGVPPLMGYLARLAARETGDPQLGQALARAFRDTVGKARAYRVQENMTDAIVARGRAMAPETTVTGGRRPPRPNGLVRLDEPLRFRNVQGEHQAAHWVGWSAFTAPGGNGWVLTLWNDVFDGPDETVRNLWHEAYTKDPAAYRGVPIADGHREMFGRWAPITIGYVIDGVDIGSEDAADGEAEFTVRAIVALWEMLGETVPARETPGHVERVEHADEHLSRTVRRRAQREGIDDPAVTTVVLRRESRPTRNPGSGTPWDSRIRIEGYEAWRWVGPRHDRRRVRRWIPAHWSVNNEELPVRQRKIVSELRR